MKKNHRDPLTIDCHYVLDEFAAAYLLIEEGEAAFIDNNTSHAVPFLMRALEQKGLSPKDVRYLIITHVHLDHAGGTSALLRHCPNATVLAHPRAARHIVDPSKLVASATAVYGQEIFEKLYGALEGIPEKRVRIMNDDESLSWGSRTLRFLHTRGHANHHFCIHDSGANAVFTGDSFGLRYPRLQKGGLFILPSTSPTDFDPDEAISSVERIASLKADAVYPTHFGEVTEIREAATQLNTHLRFYAELLSRCEEMLGQGRSPDEVGDRCRDLQMEHFSEFVSKNGIRLDKEDWDFLKMDLKLNVDGIVYAAGRRVRKSSEVRS